MKALRRDDAGIALVEVDRPALTGDDGVLIRVVCAGLCRTDLDAARGLMRTRIPVILGHEFSGVVTAIGPGVRHVSPQDAVAVMPVIACGHCTECRSGRRHFCPDRKTLGVDLDGAFAEYVVVPADSVHPLPVGMSFMLGAYAEPVAASLAVLKARDITRAQKGAIWGGNRIARLTQRVLEASGFRDVTCFDPSSGGRIEPLSLDFAVETVAEAPAFDAIIEALKPGATFILKTRSLRPIAIDLAAVLRKEITLQAVEYGRFDAALDLLASGALRVEDLLGEAHPLENFETVFEEAARNECAKAFFAIGDGVVPAGRNEDHVRHSRGA